MAWFGVNDSDIQYSNCNEQQRNNNQIRSVTRLHLNKPLAFIDVQTTGISVTQDRILEIAINVLKPDGASLIYSRLFNPARDIPEKATEINGIKDGDVVNAKKFEECAEEIAAFIGEADLAGYNARLFHIPMLMESFHRAGVEWNINERCIIDMQTIFHSMERRDLETAVRFYCNQSLPKIRRSLQQTTACVEVLKAQIDRYRGQFLRDNTGKLRGKIENDIRCLHDILASNTIDLAGKLIVDENGCVALNFGKYKGQQVAAVERDDPHYLRWLMKCNEFTFDTKRRLEESMQTKQNLSNTNSSTTITTTSLPTPRKREKNSLTTSNASSHIL